MADRFSNQEASVHAFDQMVADRYAGETSWSKRIVRERYDRPVPKTGRGITGGVRGNGNGSAAGAAEARLAARARATVDR